MIRHDKGYVTSIVAPKSISGEEINVEWVQFDVNKINGTSNEHLYLLDILMKIFHPQ